MSRTLNEDDVLKEIDRWIGYLDEDMITRIKISIRKIPSAQPKQVCVANVTLTDEQVKEVVEKAKNTVMSVIKTAPQWIPCSERLPEVGTYVLISKKALNFRSNLPSVCAAHRSCDPRNGKEEWDDMLFGKLDDDDVLAWCELPEPYKEERRENERPD